ncbi:MAG: potassium ABC transporter ATPase [Gammaproteobacteria bacterium]|nr:potassium ABC transporter ATPase [Gammaproteobacteria bacterium]
MDLIYLGLIAAFAALTAALLYGCERLRRTS